MPQGDGGWWLTPGVTAAVHVGFALTSPQSALRCDIPCSPPRLDSWQPAPDISAEFFVFVAELSAESWLFVGQNENVEAQPDNHAVLEHADAAEEQSLPEDQRDNGHVHRIAYVPVETGDNQMLRRSDRCRRAQALNGKARERIEQNGKAQGDQPRSDRAKRKEAE